MTRQSKAAFKAIKLFRRFSELGAIASPESPAIPLSIPAYLRSFAGVSLEETTMSDKNPPAPGFQYSLTNLKPAEPVHKVTLTFPDGAKREFPKSITGLEIARGIS